MQLFLKLVFQVFDEKALKKGGYLGAFINPSFKILQCVENNATETSLYKKLQQTGNCKQVQ